MDRHTYRQLSHYRMNYTPIPPIIWRASSSSSHPLRSYQSSYPFYPQPLPPCPYYYLSLSLIVVVTSGDLQYLYQPSDSLHILLLLDPNSLILKQYFYYVPPPHLLTFAIFILYLVPVPTLIQCRHRQGNVLKPPSLVLLRNLYRGHNLNLNVPTVERYNAKWRGAD